MVPRDKFSNVIQFPLNITRSAIQISLSSCFLLVNTLQKFFKFFFQSHSTTYSYHLQCWSVNCMRSREVSTVVLPDILTDISKGETTLLWLVETTSIVYFVKCIYHYLLCLCLACFGTSSSSILEGWCPPSTSYYPSGHPDGWVWCISAWLWHLAHWDDAAYPSAQLQAIAITQKSFKWGDQDRACHWTQSLLILLQPPSACLTLLSPHTHTCMPTPW